MSPCCGHQPRAAEPDRHEGPAGAGRGARLPGRAHHLQSGNVLLTTRKRSESAIARHLSDGIARATGLTIPVLVRTRAQLEAVVADDPFADARTDPSRHMVAFLERPPAPDAVARLEELRHGDELVTPAAGRSMSGSRPDFRAADWPRPCTTSR
jgi:hypothetical protein